MFLARRLGELLQLELLPARFCLIEEGNLSDSSTSLFREKTHGVLDVKIAYM